MIIMLGDIHGNFANLKYQIEAKKITNCSIIQVGDFGMTLGPNGSKIVLNELNEFLGKYGIVLYAIRGNHDDPFYFKGNHIYDNLKLLPDYTQLRIDDYNFLFVGGATSIDRMISLQKMKVSLDMGIDHKLYWTDEIFHLDEEKLKDIKDIDIVITHTSPEWCHPDNSGGVGDFVLQFAEFDPTLVDELKAERKLLTRFFNILKDNGNKIQKHFYGHFHRSEISLNGQTMHILLGINEFKLLEETISDEYEKIFNV